PLAGKTAAISSSSTILMPRFSSHFNSAETTTESCLRRGQERMPMVCNAFSSSISVCDSTRIFSRVQEILLITFRTGQAAEPKLEKLQAERFQAFAYEQHRSFVKRLARNNSSRANLLAKQLELQLDED